VGSKEKSFGFHLITTVDVFLNVDIAIRERNCLGGSIIWPRQQRKKAICSIIKAVKFFASCQKTSQSVLFAASAATCENKNRVCRAPQLPMQIAEKQFSPPTHFPLGKDTHLLCFAPMAGRCASPIKQTQNCSRHSDEFFKFPSFVKMW